MVFSSSIFLLYFLPVFLLLYYLIPNRNYRNILTLIASIFFYAWGAPLFVYVVAGSIAIDFYVVRVMASSKGNGKKLLLAFSIIINLGLLAYFKYANFLIDNLNAILVTLGMQSIHWTKVALPIGISFFTFQKITYSVDVYRQVHAPLRRVTDYAMYILMFPQLIAGPIVRFNEIADQIRNRRSGENAENFVLGFFRFVVGLSKKVLIANVLGEQVDAIFAMDPGALSTGALWAGIIAYAFQIYFDFSGYSDMAIGIGRMIGFKFPENFNNPYISQNITEFWRRWHITLGRFMRDYLYIPLGGNRVPKSRLYFNLWLVFLLSGLWHGAAWNFVVWGAFHGIFLIADRVFLLKFYRRIGKWPSIVITFIVTLVGWVFFRAQDISFAVEYIGQMFSIKMGDAPVFFDDKFKFILLLAFLFSFIGGFSAVEKWQKKLLFGEKSTGSLFALTAFSVIFMIISLSYITSQSFNPFIYFRF